ADQRMRIAMAGVQFDVQDVALRDEKLTAAKHVIDHTVAAEAKKYFSVAVILVSHHEGTRLPRVHQMQRLNFEPRIAQAERVGIALAIQTMHETQHEVAARLVVVWLMQYSRERGVLHPRAPASGVPAQ